MKKIISIDGNIGSGKSTLVEYLKQNLTSFEDFNIVYLQEPVDTWSTICDENESILEKFYRDPKRYAFSFQMMAYITRLSDIRKMYKESPDNTIIITERSLHTDYNIFAKMLYESGKIEEIEYNIYCRWFYEFIEETDISGFIYLRIPPDICKQRIEKRNRKGEQNISIDYLQELHSFHEQWLFNTNCLFLNHFDKEINFMDKIKKFISELIKNC